MTSEQIDEPDTVKTIDGLSAEDWNRRQARRAFIGMILTPVWWIVSLIVINLLAEVFPSTSADSTFVFATWGVFALLFSVTIAFTGSSHAKQIAGFADHRGLWQARGAAIGGVVFTLLTVAIIYGIFTGEDASTRQLL